MWSIFRCSLTNSNFVARNLKWSLSKNVLYKSHFETQIQNIRIRKHHCIRRKPETQCSNIKCLYLKLGVSVATGIAIKYSHGSSVLCEALFGSIDATRLVGVGASASEPDFNWRRFLDLLKPYYLEFIGAILAALACAALNIHIPRVLGDIINVLSRSLSANNDFLGDLKMPALQTALLYSLHSVFTFFYIYLMSNIGEGIAKTLKVQLFSSIVSQDMAFFDSTRTGEILNRLTVDITDFKSSFKQIVSQGLRNATQVLGCTVTLFLISPQMTAAMLVVVPTVIISGTVMGAMLRKISFDAKAQSAKVTLVAEEAVSNIRTVRAFAMEDLEKTLFEQQSELARQMNVVLGKGIALFQAGTNLFLNGMVLSTIYLGGYLVTQQQMTPGDLMAFLVAVQMLQRSFTQLSLLFGTYIKGKHAGARVFEMIDMEAQIDLDRGIIVPYHSLIPEVEFHDVYFSYPSRPELDVVQGLNLKIPVGKTVAIVGSSGSGKSTLAWLIERFYDIEEGIITLGGEPLQRLNPTWLRGRVLGFISQEPVLFATSVMENIRYGKSSATDAEVVAAAKLANAHEFITAFPQGYDTMVGERGTSVSGGQKQRIAIARALLKDPCILILDEATSALDSESERLVQDALDAVTKSRTTIVIAHRLSTVKNADLIVVLNRGRVAEMGTHNELMQKNGMYATLVRQQQLFSGK